MKDEPSRRRRLAAREVPRVRLATTASVAGPAPPTSAVEVGAGATLGDAVNGTGGSKPQAAIMSSAYARSPSPAGTPVAAGEGGGVARAARCVLVLLQSRRARGGTHMCHPGRALCRPWLGREIASREWHGAWLSRCDRDMPMVAPACAARRGPSAGRGWGGRWCRVSGTLMFIFGHADVHLPC